MDIPDVLDLVPDRQELLQFHQEEGINLAGKGELRNQWCALGIENEVPECKPLGKFSSFRKYKGHWTNMQRSTKPFYECTICRKQFASHSKGKGHLKTHRERGILEVKDVPNRGTSTGIKGVTPARYGKGKEESTNEEENTR